MSTARRKAWDKKILDAAEAARAAVKEYYAVIYDAHDDGLSNADISFTLKGAPVTTAFIGELTPSSISKYRHVGEEIRKEQGRVADQE